MGAGPAGLTSIGLLLDSGIPPQQILWIDPFFQVGDFGRLWNEVSSNTTVELFKIFLTSVDSFNVKSANREFPLFTMDPSGYCQLEAVAEVLRWVTSHFRESPISCLEGYATSLKNHKDGWQIKVNGHEQWAENVILTTGATPKNLTFEKIREQFSRKTHLSKNKPVAISSKHFQSFSQIF